MLFQSCVLSPFLDASKIQETQTAHFLERSAAQASSLSSSRQMDGAGHSTSTNGNMDRLDPLSFWGLRETIENSWVNDVARDRLWPWVAGTTGFLNHGEHHILPAEGTVEGTGGNAAVSPQAVTLPSITPVSPSADIAWAGAEATPEGDLGADWDLWERRREKIGNYCILPLGCTCMTLGILFIVVHTFLTFAGVGEVHMWVSNSGFAMLAIAVGLSCLGCCCFQMGP